jgi:hypothetical protein
VIQEGLVARLLANQGVSAIAGANIYAMLASDESQLNYPCVSYALVGGDNALQYETRGNRHQRIELNAHAFAYSDAARLREAVIVALDGWKEVLPDGNDVFACYLANPGIDFLGEDRIFRCLVEFYVDYNPPTM